MPAEPRRASTNRFASTAANGAQRPPAAPVETVPEAVPTEYAEAPRRRRKPAQGTRTSVYLAPDVSARFVAAVDDIAYRLRVPKGTVYSAIVAAGMADLEAIERQVTP